MKPAAADVDVRTLPPLAAMQAWVERAVIGLGLCPFAAAVHRQRRIRWVLCQARDADGVLADLVAELLRLARADAAAIETTVIVHPHVLQAFADYNQFLAVADAALRALGLQGTLQIASFHPQYRFAGTKPDAIANCTNRSPHPALHLLREASIERALAGGGDAEAIWRRNVATMEALGWEGWLALWLPAGSFSRAARPKAASASKGRPARRPAPSRPKARARG
jgi:hypothetical protein